MCIPKEIIVKGIAKDILFLFANYWYNSIGTNIKRTIEISQYRATKKEVALLNCFISFIVPFRYLMIFSIDISFRLDDISDIFICIILFINTITDEVRPICNKVTNKCEKKVYAKTNLFGYSPTP